MSNGCNTTPWAQEAYRMKMVDGKSYEEMIPHFRKYFPESTDVQIYERIRTRIRRMRKSGYRIPDGKPSEQTENSFLPANKEPAKQPHILGESALLKALKNGISKDGAAYALNKDRIENLADYGYEIVPNATNGTVKLNTTKQVLEHSEYHRWWDHSKKIRFGIVSDTHINSKYTQLTRLHDMYDIFRDEEIDTVYHVGDIDEGEQMRVGHQYECYNQGADSHRDEIVRVYPKKDGIVTYFITGNHDASLLRRAGFNIGKSISRYRDDMIYIGADDVLVHLTPKCTMELFHPWDGSPYSVSYKLQKRVETVPEFERPDILIMGHYHKAEYMFYHGTHCMQAGSFEGKTPFTNGKTLATVMGGWIVEVDVSDDGHILAFNPKFYPFEQPIKDDYLNWADFNREVVVKT